MSAPMEVAIIAKSGGPLTKRISLAADGSLTSDGSACVMSRGTAKRFTFAGVEQFATLIEHFAPHQAITLGGLRPDLPNEVSVTTKRKLNGAHESEVIARTSDYFVFRPGEPALALVDYDTKGMPPGVAERIKELGGLLPALASVLPGKTIATSAATIHFFTGNNIGPRGDLASRSLQTRLEVDRPDPENREFKHSDPIAWTEDHRGQILVALYTVLRGNPRRDPKNKDLEPRQTRFKEWWDLIGSAVEYAAKLAKKQSRRENINCLVGDADEPPPVRFKDLFLTQEEDDEEGASVTDALAVLSKKWPKGETGLESTFTAADVAKLANTTGEWASETDRMYAETLRDFLFPRITSATQAVTAKATGRRLNRYVGVPVRHNSEVLTLKKSPDTHANALRYYIEARTISG
jgi:hypothetical protein